MVLLTALSLVVVGRPTLLRVAIATIKKGGARVCLQKVQRSFVMNFVSVRKLACGSAQHVRRVCRAATNWKDVLDNPFYEKYKKKLEKIQG